jgi:sporulation protein YlmC with PRC-barrel domain
MQTKTIARVASMLVVLGSATALTQQAGAQQAGDEAPEPILEPDPAEVLEQTQEAPPAIMEDRDVRAIEGERWPSVGTAAAPHIEIVLGSMTVDELIGMDVVDAEGESVGSVVDLLLTADDAVDRAIIDVGGFLGFGSKLVALGLDRLTIAEGVGEVVVDVTREELEAMPEWQQDEDGWFSG